MIVVERTLAVTVAPGIALGYLTDFGHTADWDPAVRQAIRADAGPLGPGARWHQVSRICGVTTELTYTLVALEPGRLMFHGRNEGATCLDTVTVRAAPLGCEVTYRVELEVHGLAKLATPLIRMEFEKLGTASATALTDVLNQHSPDTVTTEHHFPAVAPHPTTFPARGQEAQA